MTGQRALVRVRRRLRKAMEHDRAVEAMRRMVAALPPGLVLAVLRRWLNQGRRPEG